MKEEQKRLYEHFLKLAASNNGVVGKNAKKYAEEIDKTWHFSTEKEKK